MFSPDLALLSDGRYIIGDIVGRTRKWARDAAHFFCLDLELEVVSPNVMTHIWGLAEEVAADLGLELVDLEQGGGRKRQTFRLFVDKPGGVNLTDCTRMSRQLEERLDAEDVIASSYVLEVSSPGLERPLRKAVDFGRYAGHRISLRLHERDPKSGSRKFSGVLNKIEKDVIEINVGDGVIRHFPLSGIAKAHLEVEWDAVFNEKV